MPLYEYQCEKCGEVLEKIQKFSDPPLAKCAKCGGKLKRLISPPTLQFKGSGWYVTDYARKSPPTSADKPEASSDAQTKKPSETTVAPKDGESPAAKPAPSPKGSAKK